MSSKVFAVSASVVAAVWSSGGVACETPVSVCGRDMGKSIGIVRNGRPVAIYVDTKADPAVLHVAKSFAGDLGLVSGVSAQTVSDIKTVNGDLVIIGVSGQSPVIDDLIARGKIRDADIKGKWEAFRQIVVENPYPNVRRALVIVGSDRRGAVFGTYDVSQKIGVSPWYWWADVPVEKKVDVYITAGNRKDQPKVKYRGFFINDEDPALKDWAIQKFGGLNAQMYEKVFELNLRMKSNYLWPAMWGKMFNVDDPKNMVLADEMGVIMGTSHHEPMMRAQAEWHRNKDEGVTGGAWDYTTNTKNLETFWRGGIERMLKKGDGKAYDSLVTIGMRGDGDEPMTKDTATTLLETIVADQRKIIAEVTGKPASETPQVWALYKEVQDYYDQGMKVPDDVLLLFADDNWGQIRRLPVKDVNRKGGYGVYYHFDYVGGPRNYKWLNTNQIEKTWQQMDLAYQRGADDLWIVNVGDIKPMEFPLSFFLDMAWNPEAMPVEAMSAYTEKWAAATFGPANAKDIARLLTTYSKYAARRKPELIDPKAFSVASGDLNRGGEFEARVTEWKALEAEAAAVKKKLRPDQLDAYFQIVEHPIQAVSNLYDLYYNCARNWQFAALNDARANGFADKAESAFAKDKAITATYHTLNGGKWNHMMKQVHIGYTSWNNPKADIMPELKRVAADAKPLPVSETKPLAANGYIAIEAPRFSRAVNGKGLTWKVIPNLGRTLGSVTAFPQGRASTEASDNVRLEYDVTLTAAGDANLNLFVVPTLDTTGGNGIRIGVSVDNGPVQIATYNLIPDKGDWPNAVRDNAHVLRVKLPGLTASKHTLKVWRLDDNAILQKLVLDTGGMPQLYLGAE